MDDFGHTGGSAPEFDTQAEREAAAAAKADQEARDKATAEYQKGRQDAASIARKQPGRQRAILSDLASKGPMGIL